MKIVHVFHNYYPVIGGMERAVQYLAEEQAKLGHKVTVVTSNIGADNRPKEEILGGVKIVKVKSFRFLYNDLTIPLEDPDIENVDIIHAHSQNSLFSLMMARRLKKKTRGKVVFHYMAVDAFKDHPSAIVRLLGPYYGRWVFRKALEVSDLILVRSLRDKWILENRYNVKAIYVPDGVPDYYFTMKKKSFQEFQEKFNIRQNKIFLYIGRLHRLKGPHILVKALSYIDDKDVAITFIGPDTGYKKQLIKLAQKLGVEDRVYFLGYLSEEEKINAIDSSIAIILPSICDYVEVYPMVISEAWVRGKPVIASSVGGIPYRVKNYENGILVRPSDPITLAKAINLIVEKPDLANKLGERGRSEVKSWTEIAKITIKLYEDLLRR